MRKIFLAILISTIISGCAVFRDTVDSIKKDLQNPNEPPRISSIIVGTFKCSDAMTAEAVQNIFVKRLVNNTSAKVVRSGDADMVIEGTINTIKTSTSNGVVTGITVLALHQGEIVAAASSSQQIGGRFAPKPVEQLADQAAERLRRILVSDNFVHIK